MYLFMLVLETILLLTLLIVVRIFFFVDKWIKFVESKSTHEDAWGPWSSAILKWDPAQWAFHPRYFTTWTLKQFEARFKKEFNIT